MNDIIIRSGSSIIQHGMNNNRIYLMKLNKKDTLNIINWLDKLATEKKYTKIFAKVPDYAKELFLNNNYIIEACIPGFYNGINYVYFMAKFLTESRNINTDKQIISDILNTAFSKELILEPVNLDKNFCFRKCSYKDTDRMAELYREIFTTYPFPIYNPEYLIKTMQENIEYFGIWYKSKLIALASSELDLEKQNAEMTDFATKPEYRGKNLSVYLLQKMEQEMQIKGIKTVYTIARSLSYGMNITFSRAGYTYSGTLVNNTNICGQMENMNVWYKPLI